METLIHERVRMAHEGNNPTVIRKLPSGWLVLGDNQRIRGYCLLLSDPVDLDINSVDAETRAAFLRDMVLIGDALMKATGAELINYMVLGNLDRALHAHIHPRYADEPDEKRTSGPWKYAGENVPFDLERDRNLMQQIGEAVDEFMSGT